MELADEESERVWHGLICLPVRGILGLVGLSERHRAPARVQCCVLIIREYGQHYHPPYIRHPPLFCLAKLAPLRTSRTDRQTLAHFLIRGASYTLIPKPYLENAQVINFFV